MRGRDSSGPPRIAAFRNACSSVAKRAEPRSLWKHHFPDSRTMIFPHVGHSFGIGGCLYPILTDFVDSGTTQGLEPTRCDGAVVVPPFSMPD